MKTTALLILMIFVNLILIAKIIILTPEEPIEILSYDDKKSEALIQSFSLSNKINGIQIPNFQLKNMQNKEVSLYSFTKNAWTLLLIYSDVDCYPCVDSLLSGCTQLMSNFDRRPNIVGIAYARNINYLRRYSRINEINFPLLWDHNDKAKKKLNIEKTPVILLINTNAQVVNSLFPIAGIPNINDPFFESVAHFLSEEQNLN